MTVHKVRVTRTIQGFLEGTQIWADLDADNAEDLDREAASSVSMMRKVRETKSRADGSVTIELNFDEANGLYVYAGALASGAGDNVGHEPEALGELNASRALMRKLEKLYGREVSR